MYLYHCNSPESRVDWAVDLTAIDCVGGPPEGVEAAKYKVLGCIDLLTYHCPQATTSF